MNDERKGGGAGLNTGVIHTWGTSVVPRMLGKFKCLVNWIMYLNTEKMTEFCETCVKKWMSDASDVKH